jgi:small-conductance mechanosensitive channel
MLIIGLIPLAVLLYFIGYWRDFARRPIDQTLSPFESYWVGACVISLLLSFVLSLVGS